MTEEEPVESPSPTPREMSILENAISKPAQQAMSAIVHLPRRKKLRFRPKWSLTEALHSTSPRSPSSPDPQEAEGEEEENAGEVDIISHPTPLTYEGGTEEVGELVRRGGLDLDGLRHASESLDSSEWSSLVSSSRSRNALCEFVRQTTDATTTIQGGGEGGAGTTADDSDEQPQLLFTRDLSTYRTVDDLRLSEVTEAEKDAIPIGTTMLELPPSHAALFTPSKQWIPEEVFSQNCQICMDHPVQGDGIFCPSCKTPICNECSINTVLEIVESMQGDLSEFPPKCRCCRESLIIANFEMVLRKLVPDVLPSGTKKEVLIRQYELIMIAAAFEKSKGSMTEAQISCPFCKCLTLYEDVSSVVVVHCQADDCGKCFCWRCNSEVPFGAWARFCRKGSTAESIEELIIHYTKCRSLEHIRTDIEEAIEWGAMNRCPTCHIPGQKDTNCTHISCSGGCPRWCYVCEQVFRSGHNEGWQDDQSKCPMDLRKIQEYDSSWPRDSSQAVLHYHREKTLRALREVVDRHGIVQVALLKRDLPGIFGGYSLGQIMKVGADSPMYVRRGSDYELPPTPTTATLLPFTTDGDDVVVRPPSSPSATPTEEEEEEGETKVTTSDEDGGSEQIVPSAPSREPHQQSRKPRLRWDPFDADLDDGTGDFEEARGRKEDIFVRGTLVYSLYPFEAKGGEEMTVHEGDVLRVVAISPDFHWVFVYNVRYGKHGYVPTSYLCPIRDLPLHQRRYSYVPKSSSSSPKKKPTSARRRRRVVLHATTAAVQRALRPPTPPSPGYYPCVAGWCLVEMEKSGELKMMRDLRKGDKVRSAGGSIATVVCMLKTITDAAGKNGIAPLVQLTPGLAITRHHPVRVAEDGKWQYPSSLGQVEWMPCEDVYLFLLDSGHTLFVDGIECVGLAHGFTDNEVVAHGYFGSRAVIEDLRKMPGWEDGLCVIHANGETVVRDVVTQSVVGIQRSVIV